MSLATVRMAVALPLLAAGAAACGDNTGPRHGPPAAIEQVAGDEQAAVVGALLPQALAVRVVDEYGRPVPGAAVRWSADAGGSVQPASGRTAADGTALTHWTLGTTAGAQTVTAAVEATATAPSPFVFRATAAPAAAASVAIAPRDLLVSAGGAVPLAWELRDAHGNAIGAGAATWQSRAPEVATVDGDGVVRATGLGTAQVVVSVEGQRDSILVAVAPPATTRAWAAQDGALPHDWQRPDNWLPRRVPGPEDAVYIGTAATQPSLTVPVQIARLTTAPGTRLGLDGHTLHVTGNVVVEGTVAAPGAVAMVGAGGLAGTLPGLEVRGNVALTAAAGVLGDVVVAPGGPLRPAGRTLVVEGGLLVRGAAADGTAPPGRLVLDGGADRLEVSGALEVAGEAELAAGMLRVHGHLEQAGGGRIRGTGTTVVLAGTAPQTVRFQAPGAGPEGSLLGDVEVRPSARARFVTGAHLTGTLDVYGRVEVVPETVVAVGTLVLRRAALLENAGTVRYDVAFRNEEGTVSGSAPVPGPNVAVAALHMWPGSATIQVGETVQFGVEAYDAAGQRLAGRTVTWSSSSAAATVDGAGLARGVADGIAMITAAVGGLQESRQLNVGAPQQTQNLAVQTAYLVQAVQNAAGSVPLVAGRAALLRVFVTATEPNADRPPVRARIYHGATRVATHLIPAPGASVPLLVDEEVLNSTWNLLLPGALVQPGLAIAVELDPESTVQDFNRNDNLFPRSGAPLSLTVRTVPDFRVRLVPVRQSESGLTGDVTAASMERYLGLTRTMMPLRAIDADVREVYTTNAPPLQSNDGNSGWSILLSELNALRLVEGGGRYYYGVVRTGYPSGVAGMGYVGGRASAGWDAPGTAGWVAAHEWGHNFGRWHSPCGGPGGVDQNYPHAGGIIGAVGLDMATMTVMRARSEFDIMSYCRPAWISDYTYGHVLTHVGGAVGAHAGHAHGSAAAAAGNGGSLAHAPGAPEPVVLVWGRIEGGRAVLEPAFQVTAPAQLPEEPGPYTLAGYDEAGGRLFALPFQAHEVAHGAPGARQFAFALPAGLARPDRLAALRVTGPGIAGAGERRPTLPRGAAADPTRGVERLPELRARVRWDAGHYPMVMVRDAATGRVLSFARGGDVTVTAPGRRLELVYSDGVRSTGRRVELP
jgi:hypothetical protein